MYKNNPSKQGFFWIPVLVIVGIATLFVGGVVYVTNQPRGKITINNPTVAVTENEKRLITIPYTFRWKSLKIANERGSKYPVITCFGADGGATEVKTDPIPSDIIETSGTLTLEVNDQSKKGKFRIRCVDWTGVTGANANATVNLDVKSTEPRVANKEKFTSDLTNTSWEFTFEPQGNISSGMFRFQAGRPNERVALCERTFASKECRTEMRAIFGDYDGHHLELYLSGDISEKYGGKITMSADLDTNSQTPTFRGKWKMTIQEKVYEGTLLISKIME